MVPPMNLSKTLTILAFSLPAAINAFGHDTWLNPERFVLKNNATVALDLTSGMKFPKNESAIKPERVEAARCRIAGETMDISAIEAGNESLRFKHPLKTDGVAVCWVQLHPRTLELKPEQVAEYLDEIGATEDLRKEWEAMTPPRWRESYRKNSKTILRVGLAKSESSWKDPVGMPLEIVPERDPTQLRPNAKEMFSVRVLKNGEPLADFPLNAVRGGESKGETRKTDSAGLVSFLFDKPGRWLLRGTEVRRSSQPDVDWESDFTTLTLEVGAE